MGLAPLSCCSLHIFAGHNIKNCTTVDFNQCVWEPKLPQQFALNFYLPKQNWVLFISFYSTHSLHVYWSSSWLADWLTFQHSTHNQSVRWTNSDACCVSLLHFTSFETFSSPVHTVLFWKKKKKCVCDGKEFGCLCTSSCVFKLCPGPAYLGQTALILPYCLPGCLMALIFQLRHFRIQFTFPVLTAFSTVYKICCGTDQ